MTKITITFDSKIEASYIKSKREKVNKILQEKTLDAIRERFIHTSKLSNEELLEWCTIKND